MPAPVEAAVLEWRRTHPSWGPRRLVHEAVKAGLEPVPSRSGVYRALLRAGLIDPEARRPRDRRCKRWERAHPMELWQMDIVGGMGLADGSELKILAGVDDHSRYCVVAAVMRRATDRAVCQASTAALSGHGVPPSSRRSRSRGTVDQLPSGAHNQRHRPTAPTANPARFRNKSVLSCTTSLMRCGLPHDLHRHDAWAGAWAHGAIRRLAYGASGVESATDVDA